MSKKSISICLVAVALLAFAPCAEAKELKKDFHETFEVDKGDRLRLKHGDVTLREVRARILNVRTEDGDIRLDLLKEIDVDFNIRSEDGSVTITLDPGISAAYSIEVDDGSTNIDLPEALKVEDGSDLITGEIGGGKGRIRIKTADGSVTMKASK